MTRSAVSVKIVFYDLMSGPSGPGSIRLFTASA